MTAFAIHYMKPDVFRDFNMGVEWLKERGKLPTLATLENTHVFLREMVDLGTDTSFGKFDVALERIFIDMQGENWSPNGEARPLIKQKGLRHTSMSVGDAVVVGGKKLYLVDRFGFKEIDSA